MITIVNSIYGPIVVQEAQTTHSVGPGGRVEVSPPCFVVIGSATADDLADTPVDPQPADEAPTPVNNEPSTEFEPA
jgi:hypothetical protein